MKKKKDEEIIPSVHRSPGHTRFLRYYRDLFAHFKRTRSIRKLYKITCIPHRLTFNV